MVAPEHTSHYDSPAGLQELMTKGVEATLAAYGRTGGLLSLEEELNGLAYLDQLRETLHVAPQEDFNESTRLILESANPRDSQIKRALAYVLLSKIIGPNEKRELSQVWAQSISSSHNRVCPRIFAGHYAASVAGDLAKAMPERRDIKDMEKVLDSGFGHLRQALGCASIVGAGVGMALYGARRVWRT